MPHLSAPVDQGTFIPKPPLSLFEKLFRGLLVVAVIAVGLAIIATRGAILR